MKQLTVHRLILMLVAAVLLGLTGAGCKHTANGAGQDIEHMGEKIQEKTQ